MISISSFFYVLIFILYIASRSPSNFYIQSRFTCQVVRLNMINQNFLLLLCLLKDLVLSALSFKNLIYNKINFKTYFSILF